jgi:hypothetical protein
MPQSVWDEFIALRRQRVIGKHIAKAAGVPTANVGRVLQRAGLRRILASRFRANQTF